MNINSLLQKTKRASIRQGGPSKHIYGTCAACGRSWNRDILVVEAEEPQEHHGERSDRCERKRQINFLTRKWNDTVVRRKSEVWTPNQRQGPEKMEEHNSDHPRQENVKSDPAENAMEAKSDLWKLLSADTVCKQEQ